MKKDESLSVLAPRITYNLPADLESVLDVRWESVGPTGQWVRVRRWSVDRDANVTDYPSGKSIDIFDPMSPGQ